MYINIYIYTYIYYIYIIYSNLKYLIYPLQNVKDFGSTHLRSCSSYSKIFHQLWGSTVKNLPSISTPKHGCYLSCMTNCSWPAVYKQPTTSTRHVQFVLLVGNNFGHLKIAKKIWIWRCTVCFSVLLKKSLAAANLLGSWSLHLRPVDSEIWRSPLKGCIKPDITGSTACVYKKKGLIQQANEINTRLFFAA